MGVHEYSIVKAILLPYYAKGSKYSFVMIFQNLMAPVPAAGAVQVRITDVFSLLLMCVAAV